MHVRLLVILPLPHDRLQGDHTDQPDQPPGSENKTQAQVTFKSRSSSVEMNTPQKACTIQSRDASRASYFTGSLKYSRAQGLVLHTSDCTLGPRWVQLSPPYSGTGLVQARDLCLCPPPHVTSHSVQLPQWVYAPFTKSKKKTKQNKNKIVGLPLSCQHSPGSQHKDPSTISAKFYFAIQIAFRTMATE